MGLVFCGSFGYQNCVEIAAEYKNAIEHKNKRKQLRLRRGIDVKLEIEKTARRYL